MAEITTTELAAALGDYSRKQGPKLLTRLYQKTESENYMTTIIGVKDEYVGTTVDISELMQAFQCGWTPKGVVAINPIINKVRPYKVDLDFECLEKLQRSYESSLFEEGKKPSEQPIAEYIMKLMIDKLTEEKELNAALAEYVAPTTGVAGSAANAFDGFLTTLKGLITAGSVTPITTGALSAAGLFDTLEEFVTEIPALYRKKGGVLLMSDTRATQLYIDHRNSFSTTYYPDKPFMIKFANTAITAVGLTSMEGSDRVLMTPKSNFYRMIDIHDSITKGAIQVENNKRGLSIWFDGKIGYGFGRTEEIFCNEQE